MFSYRLILLATHEMLETIHQHLVEFLINCGDFILWVCFTNKRDGFLIQRKAVAL